MAKWILVLLFLIIFPLAAFAQDNNTQIMQTWVQKNFGVSIPNPEISQEWKSMPMLNGCQYEWNVQWKDAKFQVKDQNENYYRVYYQGDTLTLDFKKDFNWVFGS